MTFLAGGDTNRAKAIMSVLHDLTSSDEELPKGTLGSPGMLESLGPETAGMLFMVPGKKLAASAEGMKDLRALLKGLDDTSLAELISRLARGEGRKLGKEAMDPGMLLSEQSLRAGIDAGVPLTRGNVSADVLEAATTAEAMKRLGTAAQLTDDMGLHFDDVAAYADDLFGGEGPALDYMKAPEMAKEFDKEAESLFRMLVDFTKKGGR